MPSTHSGRIVKARRASKQTATQKNHRWESFTTKISKLHSLDPLRKVRRHDLDAEDLSSTTSYLRNGLEKWADLNITHTFIQFKRELAPLCDSLPQILHFEDKIMETLASYIGRHDKETLEPLLDILTAFAHDLGVRFEKHYARALGLIAGIASKPQAVEVIEWTFAALAFLFKYLSRLLVADIRPTYDALAPLLGKSRHPQYIARFAAEALSFLIKKAAAPGSREKALPLIIDHARRDLHEAVESQQFELYYHGLMTMFAEAIKSSGQTIHSTGPDTFVALVRAVPDDDDESAPREGDATWADLCCGVLTSTIHHSNEDTFKALGEAVISETSAATSTEDTAPSWWKVALHSRLLGVMSGVRKGSRVSNWPSLIQALSKALQSASKAQVRGAANWDDMLTWQHVIISAAICWDRAPMDALLPSISSLMATMARDPLERWYIPFCVYFADLNPDRFRSLFQSHFQRFIVTHWSDGENERMLCVVLPRMVSRQELPPPGDKNACPLPQSWQDQIVSKFERLEITPFPERGAYDKDPKIWRDECLPKYASLLQVLESTTVHPSTNARIAELLLRKIKLALRPSSSFTTDESHFIVGQGTRAYLRMSKAAGSVDVGLQPLLRAAAPRFCRLQAFLDAFLAFEQELGGKKAQEPECGSESPQTEEDPLVKALIGNLSAPSHDLRLTSLRILSLLEPVPDQQSCLDIMMQVEQMPLEAQNARAIAVVLRRLAQVYQGLPDGSYLMHAVPAFLFGMLTVRLSPVWDEALEALKKVVDRKAGEDIVATLAFGWLGVPSPRWAGPVNPVEGRRPFLTDFECLNMMQLQDTAKLVKKIAVEAPGLMLDQFENSQGLVAPHPDNARSKALKVLAATSALAERRSRQLVPHLFSWNETGSSTPEDAEEDHDPSENESWSLADRKALVGIFSQFVNPRVLFQSQKAYDTLLSLMANGDIELQKLALKAILSWKQEGVKPYQENLEYLLDEARFKNELTVLFLGDHKMKPEHRSEVMPVLLRLLYGRTISKKGAASGKGGLHATRLTVLRHLEAEDLSAFLDIAMGGLRDVRIVDSSGILESVFAETLLPPRKQLGLLNMLDAAINEFGTKVQPHMGSLVNAVLYCLISACRGLRGTAEDADNDGAPAEGPSHTSLHRAVRTIGLKCLSALFRNAPAFGWTPYQDAIVVEIISPRLDKLPTETTQGVSGSLRLLSTWSQSSRTALLFSVDGRILPKVVECLGMEKTKKEVKTFVLDIIQNLVSLVEAPATADEPDGLVKLEVLGPNLDTILRNIAKLLRSEHDIDRDLLEACIQTVVKVSPLVEQSDNVENLVDISTFLLRQPSRKVSPKIKSSILLILERFITIGNFQAFADLKHRVYLAVSSLFGFFKDRENRQTLCRIMHVFVAQGALAQEIADACSNLNSYVERRMDQPDYDRRLAAFNAVSTRESALTVDEWLPLLYNMIYYIRQDEEFGVLASSSADGLCKFIDATRSAWEDSSKDLFVEQLSKVVVPAIQSGMRESSETTRRENLRVLSYLASHLSVWHPVADLKSLAPSSDEGAEDTFFFNILSPAHSKQLQALHILVRENTAAELSSKNVSQIFIPLLEHFIFGREGGADDQGLGAQATSAIASLSLALEWPQFRVLLRRFISYLESKPELQKQIIRLLERVTDSLATAADQASNGSAEVDTTTSSESAAPRKCRLARTLPETRKLGDELINNLLPPMLDRLHEKDESTVSARVPVGIIVVKLLHLLPDEQANQKLPGVLTDICHILRSKAWEAREMARETLAKITAILGPSSFGFVVKELRGALARGYQLHVLSYTIHSLLLSVLPTCKQGDLDYCLGSLMAVIMDDIFGATGQEKDADEYTSQMKEVKSSKSQDSMELIAKTASINHLVDLVQPLQSMLMEKLDLRMVRKIDDLLSRITAGLLQNPASESQDTLIFCYEVIKEAYKSEKPEAGQKIEPRLRRYLVQKGAKRSGERSSMAKYTHKVVRFAIDLLRSVLRKHDSLRTPGAIAGFLPILGDAVVGGEEEVKNAACKLLTVLVKVPFKADLSKDLYNVATREAFEAISTSQSMGSDIAQSALKLISVVLRERHEVTVRDSAIDVLLGKVKDDLTEPLYRHITFNFLRAVLDRKVQTAVVYDVLDYVGTVMITNEDNETRSLARGAFFHFIRDFPQKKTRWAKQLQFIVANLEYEREGGRLSVMETVHLLLSKSADDFVQEVASTCFIPLVFRLANDDSEKCRQAAGELIKQVFKKADQERLQRFLTLLRGWTQQNGNVGVLSLGVEAFGFYLETLEDDSNPKADLDLLVKKIAEILGNLDKPAVVVVDSDLVNTSLRVMHVLVGKFPSRGLAKDTRDLWAGVRNGLLSSETPVQISAIKLLGLYLVDFASSSSGTTPRKGGVFLGSHGLTLDKDEIKQLVRLNLRILKVPDLDESLAEEVGKMLGFLSTYLEGAAPRRPTEAVGEEEEEDDDEHSGSEGGGGGEEEEEEEEEEEADHDTDLKYLFWRLSLVIRRETQPKATMLVAKTAAMDVLSSLCDRTSAAEVLPSIKTIMRPLRNLTDPTIPAPFSMDELFKTRHEALKNRAQLVLEALQKKLGSAEYMRHLVAVGEEIRERRQQRSTKRKIGAVAQPEKHGRDKRKRTEKKKDRRKAKGHESRSFRQEQGY